MKKFAISIATLAIALGACGNMNEENTTNHQNQQVEEEPETISAMNNEDNNGNNDLENDSDNDLNNDQSEGVDAEEETESVMDQGIENFELNITLVDDAQWDFTYSAPENGEEEPIASLSGNEMDLEGEQAIDEMENYLADLHITPVSDEEEITAKIADTFSFNESSFREYDLTMAFSDQDSETVWNWSQDDDGLDLSDNS